MMDESILIRAAQLLESSRSLTARSAMGQLEAGFCLNRSLQTILETKAAIQMSDKTIVFCGYSLPRSEEKRGAAMNSNTKVAPPEL